MAGQFIDLARAMVADQPGEQLTIKRVLQFAARAVPGCEDASVTRVTTHSRPHTVAATSDLPGKVSELQYQCGEGPCLEALERSDVVHTGELATERQWPRFGPLAVTQLGIHSLLSFRLFLTNHERGSLNFVSRQPEAFDTMALSIGAIFASYTSLVLLNDFHRDENMQLHRALESNREIGMAMGILMARELCTSDEAFHQLRSASQHLHRKLHELAGEVIETGTLPVHRLGDGGV
jgi:hypothetical protein